MSFLSHKGFLSFVGRAEEFLWYVLLVSLPIQRRVIVYQATWDFQEWLSFALYGTDVLFVLLLVVAFVRHPQWWKSKIHRYEYFLAAFVAVSALSIAVSSHPVVSMLAVVRVLEFAAFYWYVSRYALSTSRTIWSLAAFIAGIVAQAVIAVSQFFVQHDLGLRILGESILSPSMQGVASFYLATGEKVMRAYGTTPHPNVLAAYLMVGLIAVCALFIQRGVARKTTALFVLIYGLLVWALVLTFSRTIIALWVLAMGWVLFMIWRHEKTRKACAIVVLATVAYGAVLFAAYQPEIMSRLTISSQDEAVQLRVYYSGQALASGGRSINWLGVGAGNFVGWLEEQQPRLARYLYQPVHNIYLLLYSEVGSIGLVLWLGFIGMAVVRARRLWPTMGGVGVLAVAGAMYAAGFLDHFPWTLQQGRFLLWGALACVSFCVEKRHEIV